jgi:hypothetical protein
MMSAQRWERYAPLTGVLAVVLWVVGFLALMSTGTRDPNASPEQVLAYYQTNSVSLVGGGFVFMLGAVSLVWFLGSLRSSLQPAEGGVGRLTSIAFGGGVAMAVCALLLPAGDVAISLAASTISATAADAMHYLPGVFFIGVELFAAVLVGATGLVALRTAVLPRRLGWVSLLLALVLLIPPLGWLGILFGIPIWTVLVSLLLMRSAGVSRAGDAPLPGIS